MIDSDKPDQDDPRFGTSPWYVQDGQPMSPTAIGYEGAAFYRYRARLGAEFENRIEFEPSWQWGCLT